MNLSFLKEQRINEILKRHKIFLIFFSFFLTSTFYFFFENWKEKRKCDLPDRVLITKVIDGDTVVAEGGREIRLLGIDTDEKGYPCFESAKKLLENLVLGKEVKLEREKENVDKYGRCLRYLILEGKNLNFELVKFGEAVCRFLDENSKYREFCEKLEKEAIEKKIGCKWEEKRAEKEKIKSIPACQAKKHIGENVFVEGKVVSVSRSKRNNLFLNFEKPYPYQCFTAVIFNSSLSRFPENPEEIYNKKRVRVFGQIKEYKKRPEIILEAPSQIEILE